MLKPFNHRLLSINTQRTCCVKGDMLQNSTVTRSSARNITREIAASSGQLQITEQNYNNMYLFVVKLDLL